MHPEGQKKNCLDKGKIQELIIAEVKAVTETIKKHSFYARSSNPCQFNF